MVGRKKNKKHNYRSTYSDSTALGIFFITRKFHDLKMARFLAMYIRTCAHMYTYNHKQLAMAMHA